MLSSLHRFQQDEVAQQRLKIIPFSDRHGEQATQAAFGVSRQVISSWKKKIAQAGGHLTGWSPHSTRPNLGLSKGNVKNVCDLYNLVRSSRIEPVHVFSHLPIRGKLSN